MSWLARIGGSLAFPGEYTQGIKVGPKEQTDWGWRDLEGPIEFRATGKTPNFVLFPGTNLGSYHFDIFGGGVQHAGYFSYHVPHDYVLNSEVFFHVHWIPLQSQVGGVQVQFQFEYCYAKGHDQENFDFLNLPTPVTITDTSPSEQQYRHMVSESSTGTIIPGMEPDGIILASLIRQATGDTASDSQLIGIFTCDIHYQSTNLATINKSPNFYGD